MSNLNDLLNLSREIEFKLIESCGEITPEIEALTTDLDISLPEKIDAYAFTMDRMEMNQAWYQEKMEEYEKLKRGSKIAHENIKNRLKEIMVHRNITDLGGHRERFKLSAGKPKLLINELLVPQDFMVETRTIEPDKDLIRTCLGDGMVVPGCEFEQTYALTKRVVKK